MNAIKPYVNPNSNNKERKMSKRDSKKYLYPNNDKVLPGNQNGSVLVSEIYGAS